MATSREEPGEGGRQQGFVQGYQVFSTQRRGMLQTSTQKNPPWWLGRGG